MPVLENFLLSLPIVGIACVINRPGYVARYRNQYQDGLWYMCKMAFPILTERSAKFADERDRKLEIFYEATGKKEDSAIVQYLRELKTQGSPFSENTSGNYGPLSPEDYKRIIMGEPRQRTKKTPMIQIADLVLYPMAKGGYDPNYRPYSKLKEGDKLVDCLLPESRIGSCGIKYSCFDG